MLNSTESYSVEASPNAFDFDRFANPFPGDNPAGPDLRYSSLFGEIREARRADDPILPQGVWVTGLKTSDWSRVQSICSQALLDQSKDIRLAAWLSESWIYLHGLGSLVSVLKLFDILVDRFSETFHPKPETSDTEIRLAAFEKALDLIIAAIIAVPIFDDAYVHEITLITWRQACFDARSNQEDTSKTPTTTTLTNYEAVLRKLPPVLHTQCHAHLREARQQLLQLEKTSTIKFAGEQPGFYRLRDVIDEITNIVNQIMPVDLHSSAAASWHDARANNQGDEVNDARPIITASPSLALNDSPQTRAQAYAQLESIASFLQKEEPHSPAPFLIRRAIIWGSMDLPQLFDELFQEGQDVQYVRRLLGF